MSAAQPTNGKSQMKNTPDHQDTVDTDYRTSLSDSLRAYPAATPAEQRTLHTTMAGHWRACALAVVAGDVGLAETWSCSACQ